MSDEIRKDIEKVNDALNHEEEMLNWYSKEKDDAAIRNGEITESYENGRKDEKLELARNLKNEKIDIEVISRTTGLSISEIEKL